MSFDADGTPEPTRAYAVPTAGTAHTCAYCGAPFATTDHLALHRGLVHPERLTDTETAAFEAAREAEERSLRRFRLVSLGVVVLLYFLLVMVYALV